MITSKSSEPKKFTISSIKEIENQNKQKTAAETHKFLLSEKEAKAASPADVAVCGEEDPGEALEFLITDDESKI